MKGQNNGKNRRIRKQNEKVMNNPPDGLNAYKRYVIEYGQAIKMRSGRLYKYATKPSHRLTRVYGFLIEELLDKKGLKTGKTKEHMRYSAQLVRV